MRDAVRRLPGGTLGWRIMISIVGFLVIVVGIVLLPLPGPGWLIIFAGLGLWATEFRWAARLLTWARAQVMRWTQWLLRQSRWLQALVAVLGVALLAGVAFISWSIF